MNTLIRNDPRSTVIEFRAPRPAEAPSVSVHLQTSGPWKIIVIQGEMDIVVLPLLPDLRGGVDARAVFDLGGVTFMDCCALGALIRRQRRIASSGGWMRLVARAGPVLRLLQLTGTSDLFSTFDTLDRALHAPVPIGPHEAA